MPRRLGILLAALAMGGLFVAGLFVHGRLGGVLLLVTAVLLAGLSAAVWNQVNPRRRPVRVVIVAAVAVIGLVKLIHG